MKIVSAILELNALLRGNNGLLRELIVSLSKTPALTPRTLPSLPKLSAGRVRTAADVTIETRETIAARQAQEASGTDAPSRNGERAPAAARTFRPDRPDNWLG